MDKKLFAFDLDGTLLNHQETLSSKTLEGIKKLQDSNHEVVIITGRSWLMAKHIYKLSGLNSPIGLLNGGLIYKGNDKDFITYENEIDKDSLIQLVNNETFNKTLNNFSAETKNSAFVSDINSIVYDLYVRWAKIEPSILKDSKEILDIKEKVISIIGEVDTNEEDTEKMSLEIESSIPSLSISYWKSGITGKMIMIFTRQNSRKDYALKKLADYYNIDMKDTIAFGDAYNDKYMLINAGKGIAMKNAKENMINFANEITEFTNDEDGVMKHIFNKILI